MDLSETEEIYELIDILRSLKGSCDLSDLIKGFRTTDAFRDSTLIQAAFKKHGPAKVLEANPKFFIVTRQSSAVTVTLVPEQEYIHWVIDYLEEINGKVTVTDLARPLRDAHPKFFNDFRPGVFLQKYSGIHWDYFRTTDNNPYVQALEDEESSEEEEQHSCSTCSRVFASSTALSQHHKSKHYFPCTDCGIAFQNKQAFEAHHEEYHTFPCDECSEEFSDEDELQEHVHEAHTQTWECDYCTKTFKTESGRQMHTTAVHSRLVQCHICSKKCPSQAAFQNHMDTFHWTKADLEPPVDGDGEWLSRKQLEEADTEPTKKSFGAFDCHNCSNRWTSAHSFFGYAQGCKLCNVESKPSWMWKNSTNTWHEKNDRNTQKPHLRDKCQACKMGICQREKSLVEEAMVSYDPYDYYY